MPLLAKDSTGRKTKAFWIILTVIFASYPLGLAPVALLALLPLASATRWLAPAAPSPSGNVPLDTDLPGKLGLAFIAWMVLTNLWAKDLPSAVGSTLAFVLIYSLATRSSRLVMADWPRFMKTALPAIFVATTLLHLTLVAERIALSNRASFFGLLGANYAPSLSLVATGFSWGYLASDPFPWAARIRLPWALLAGAAVFATGSRGGLLGFGVFLLIGVFWAAKRSPRLALLGASLALVVLLLFSPLLLKFGLTRQYDAERLKMWRAALRMTKDHPLGLGLQGYGFMLARYVPELSSYHFAHNIYFQVGADLGYPGVALFLAYLLALVADGARTVSRTGNPMTATLLATFIAMLIRELVDVDLIYSGGVDVAFWFIPAILRTMRNQGVG